MNLKSLPSPISSKEKEDKTSQSINDQNEVEAIKRGLGLSSSRETKKADFLQKAPKINGSINLSQLSTIGEGGTHDVYTIDGANIVMKINRGVLDTILKTGESKMEGDLLNKAKQYIDVQNNGYLRLYDSFSEENCMIEDVSIQKIRLDDGKEIECVVVLQEGSDLFEKADIIDFTCANSDSILAKLDSDQELEKCVREFLMRFEDYMNSTDNYIDLVGEKNVLMSKEGEKWRFRLGSVIKGDNRSAYLDAKRKTNEEKELSKEELNHYENGKQNSEFLNTLSQRVLGRDVC